MVAVATAWALALAAAASGNERLLHQHGQAAHGPPLWTAALLFVVAWQAMLVAMMLPSSLPLIRMFAAVARRQQNAGRVTTAFLGGYGAVWTLFGLAAFFADVTVHRLVDSSSWLAQRPWLIGGGALLIAGAFQFTGLKDRCLRECRHPGPFLVANYRRGVAGGFQVGRRHGVFCLGCCWALMLVMFGLGAAELWWMAALTVLMIYEKTGRYGAKVVHPAGVVLLGSAVLQLAHPAWLPNALGGPKAFASDARIDPRHDTRTIRIRGYELEVGLGPSHAFDSESLALRVSRAGHPITGARAAVTLTMLDMAMPSLQGRLAESSPGSYRGSIPALEMAGRWGVSIEITPRRGAAFGLNVIEDVAR